MDTLLRARTRLPSCVLAIVVAGGALVLGACAGDSAPTHDAYVAAADRVCEDTAEDIEELEVQLYEGAAGKPGPDAEEEVDLHASRPERWIRAEVVPEYRDMDSRLRSLPPPEGDRTYLTDLYDDLRHLTDELHNRPSQGRDLIREDEELRQRFEDYGMEVCGTV